MIDSRKGLKVHRFLGVSLGGGKTDRTCAAMTEYFPQQNKIFLSRLFEKIQSQGDESGDLELYRLIESSGDIETLAFDVPLSWPKCIRCRLKCPGYERCQLPEILWMWKQHRQSGKKKQKRLFTPYTERCVEKYLQTELEASFHLNHALGANLAPLTARAHFLLRWLKRPAIEVFPRLSLYRVGRNLGVSRSHLLFHKHVVSGEDSRKVILEKMISSQFIFIYEQDRRAMIENNQAFEAFLCALTAVLNFQGRCEPRPSDFPKSEGWIAIPKSVT